jgi:hypothetical protein
MLDHLTGVTQFNSGGVETPEAILLRELHVIDEHHGEYSASPPYSLAIVYGTEWTPALAEAFAGIGFRKLKTTPDGFIAMREMIVTPSGQC